MVRTSSQQSRVIRLGCEAVCPTPGPDRSSVLLVIVSPPASPAFPVLVPLRALAVLPVGPLLDPSRFSPFHHIPTLIFLV
jgi:hypothetical protein